MSLSGIVISRMVLLHRNDPRVRPLLADLDAFERQGGGTVLTRRERRLAIASGALLLIGGVAGAVSGWAGASDSLPFLVVFVTLPALAVWHGYRLPSVREAVGIPALFGAVFAAPSFVINSEGLATSSIFLLLACGGSALVAGVAYAIRPAAGQEPGPGVQKIASQARTISLIGIVLFPQLLQPAAYHMARSALSVSGAGDGNAARTAMLVSKVMLALVALISIGSIVIAALDAP